MKPNSTVTLNLAPSPDENIDADYPPCIAQPQKADSMTVDLLKVCLLFTPTLWSHYTNFQESPFNKSKREVLIFLKDLEGQLHQTHCLHCSRCINAFLFNVSVKRRFLSSNYIVYIHYLVCVFVLPHLSTCIRVFSLKKM